MKRVITFLILFVGVHSFAQTEMTIHLNNGSEESFLLTEIDSITYDNNGGGGTFVVGGQGEAGIVFYDKGSYSNGWRYLEVLGSILNTAPWGCDGTFIGGTSDAIGSGVANTQLIVSACSTPGIAAKVADNYTSNSGGVSYSDWFLPSIEELNLLYNAFTSNSSNFPFIGPFDSFYSSTENTSQLAWRLDFGSGNFATELKSIPYPTLTIRRF